MGISGTIAAVSSLASAGLSAASTIEKGKGQKAAGDYQAARDEQAAEYGRTKAAQTDAQARENLNVTLGNIDAVRAAAGVDPSSPTTAALRDRTSMLGDRARSIQVDNILAQSMQDQNDAAYMRSAGSYAMSMADLSAGATVAGGIAKTNFSSFGFGGGGGPTGPDLQGGVWPA